ncbi:hypothetical protein RJZ90_003623 [Blastomyces dermatitidis]
MKVLTIGVGRTGTACCLRLACVSLCKELIEAYPNAKVILTTRDRVTDPEHRLVSDFSWTASMYRPMLQKFFDTFFKGDFPNKGKQVYLNHVEEVRSLVPKQRLLEYKIGEGWVRYASSWVKRFQTLSSPEEASRRGLLSGAERGIAGR